MDSDDGNDIDALVALFEDASNSSAEVNEKETINLLTDDDDYGIEIVNDEMTGSNNLLRKTENEESQKGHTPNVNSLHDQEDEIQSIKAEIVLTKARLSILEEKLAEKELLRDARKANVTKKPKQVNQMKKEDPKPKRIEKTKMQEQHKETEVLFKKKERKAHIMQVDPKMDRSGIDNVNIEKKKLNIDKKNTIKTRTKESEPEWQTELYSGIRIINPHISSQQMESKMEGRRFIKLYMIPRYIINGEISGDWVTAGVIVKKQLPKTAANGKTFSIWKLSDLVGGYENEYISFFLFGDVYKEHWKMSEGNVIAILNASVMPQRDNDHVGAVAITLDNPRKLMIVGKSKDFGYCQSFTKGGSKCSLIINKFLGEYCEHHVTREYKKIKSKRMEFQSGSTGPDVRKAQQMRSLKKEIDSGQLYYGGQALTWKEKGASKKKADTKKLALSALVGSSSTESWQDQKSYVDISAKDSCSMKQKDFSSEERSLLSEDFKDRLKIPTLGSRNLLKFLKKDEEEEKEKTVVVKPDAKSAKDLIKEQRQLLKQKLKPVNINISSLKPKMKARPVFDTNFKPSIGSAHNEDDFIEFCDSDDIVSNSLNSKWTQDSSDISESKTTPLSSRSVRPNEAKLKALALLRTQKIKIAPQVPKKVSKKKSPDAMARISERVRKDISHEDSENCEPSKKRRKGLLEDALGVLDLESEEGKKILQTESAHAGRVRLAEAEREAAYFNVLEKKEMYEEKMKNIMEMNVKVVCCKICKYMHEFQSDYCKDQGHFIVRVDASKRFFLCKNCRHRTTSFKKLPAQSCSNCGGNNFERTPMFQEKKGPKIGAETLLVRGEEHSRFLNSLK